MVGKMPRNLEWTPELVESFWSKLAHTKLEQLSFSYTVGPLFLKLVRSFLSQKGKHLDFGAGSGYFVKLLLENGYQTAGFDPSNDRQSKLANTVGDHPLFLGTTNQNSTETFDTVFFMEVIEHLLDEDFDSVLDRLISFVKPGGYLIVSTPNNENLEFSKVYCPASDYLFHPWQHVRSFTSLQLKETFEKRNLKTVLEIEGDFSGNVSFYQKAKRFDDIIDFFGPNHFNSIFEKILWRLFNRSTKVLILMRVFRMLSKFPTWTKKVDPYDISQQIQDGVSKIEIGNGSSLVFVFKK